MQTLADALKVNRRGDCAKRTKRLLAVAHATLRWYKKFMPLDLWVAQLAKVLAEDACGARSRRTGNATMERRLRYLVKALGELAPTQPKKTCKREQGRTRAADARAVAGDTSASTLATASPLENDFQGEPGAGVPAYSDTPSVAITDADAGDAPPATITNADAGDAPPAAIADADAGDVPSFAFADVDAGDVPSFACADVDAGDVPPVAFADVDAGDVPPAAFADADAGEENADAGAAAVRETFAADTASVEEGALDWHAPEEFADERGVSHVVAVTSDESADKPVASAVDGRVINLVDESADKPVASAEDESVINLVDEVVEKVVDDVEDEHLAEESAGKTFSANDVLAETMHEVTDKVTNKVTYDVTDKDKDVDGGPASTTCVASTSSCGAAEDARALVAEVPKEGVVKVAVPLATADSGPAAGATAHTSPLLLDARRAAERKAEVLAFSSDGWARWTRTPHASTVTFAAFDVSDVCVCYSPRRDCEGCKHAFLVSAMYDVMRQQHLQRVRGVAAAANDGGVDDGEDEPPSLQQTLVKQGVARILEEALSGQKDTVLGPLLQLACGREGGGNPLVDWSPQDSSAGTRTSAGVSPALFLQSSTASMLAALPRLVPGSSIGFFGGGSTTSSTSSTSPSPSSLASSPPLSSRLASLLGASFPVPGQPPSLSSSSSSPWSATTASVSRKRGPGVLDTDAAVKVARMETPGTPAV
jgi:hypothetical protein